MQGQSPALTSKWTPPHLYLRDPDVVGEVKTAFKHQPNN